MAYMSILYRMYRSFTSVPPIFVDGLIYSLLALFTGMSLTFGSDDAEKFMEPVTLFWAKAIISWSAAILLALKMYRSTAYAEHKAAKDAVEAGTKTETVSETKITTESKLPNEKTNP